MGPVHIWFSVFPFPFCDVAGRQTFRDFFFTFIFVIQIWVPSEMGNFPHLGVFCENFPLGFKLVRPGLVLLGWLLVT